MDPGSSQARRIRTAPRPDGYTHPRCSVLNAAGQPGWPLPVPAGLPSRLDPHHATGCHQTKPHHHRELEAGDWLAAVTAATDAAGFRLTPARTTLLVWIARRDGAFRVDDLASGAGSRSTTYRFIRWLRTEGWIARTTLDRRAGADDGYVRRTPVR